MKVLSLVSFFVSSLVSTGVWASHQTQVTSLVANGTGCGMVTPWSYERGGQLHIITGSMSSTLKEGDRFDRKNCQITLALAPVAGHYFEVEVIRVRGFMDLASGVGGDVTLSSYIQGESEEAFRRLVIKGSKRSYYSLDLETPLRSACEGDRALNINTALKLLDRSGGHSHRSALTGFRRVSVKLAWKPCR